MKHTRDEVDAMIEDFKTHINVGIAREIARLRLLLQTYTDAPEPDEIDWSHVGDGLKWMARDVDDSVKLFSAQPELDGKRWSTNFPLFAVVDVNRSFTSYRKGNTDAADSLVERPS